MSSVRTVTGVLATSALGTKKISTRRGTIALRGHPRRSFDITWGGSTATAGPTDRSAIPIRGWFGEADPDFRREFVALGRSKFIRPAAPSTTPVRPDWPCSASFPAFHGAMQVRAPGRRDAAHAPRGDWVGTVPVLFDRPRRVTAVARTDVELLRVPGDELRGLLGRRPEWALELARDSIFYLDVAMQGAADLLIRYLAARCAAVLLRLGGQRWAASPDANLPSEIPAPQSELAMLCNVSRNTFGRVLSGFAGRRLVDVHYKSLTIVDPTKLRDIADGG